MKILTQTLQNLVTILNDQRLHSEDDLSQALHISENEVRQYINQLSEHGIEIESIQSVGYRLQAPLSLLNEAKIRAALADQAVDIELLGSVSSTNDFPKQERKRGLSFRLAEHQTQGRGRFGRSWVAPFGANILMSCRFSLSHDLSQCGGLSLCVGLAIVKALREFGLEGLACKWPNDVVYQQQKLAGVLIELQSEADGTVEAIIGIGCNVNMSAAHLAEIDRPTTSLQVILGRVQDRNQVAALLIQYLQAYLQRFAQKGFADFETEWQARDALYHQSICLNLGADQVSGIVAGVDAVGHLLLTLASGEVRAYSAGEASLSKR